MLIELEEVYINCIVKYWFNRVKGATYSSIRTTVVFSDGSITNDIRPFMSGGMVESDILQSMGYNKKNIASEKI